MEDEPYFTVDGNEWQQQNFYESEDHPHSEKKIIGTIISIN
jgi:hypothetical protein